MVDLGEGGQRAIGRGTGPLVCGTSGWATRSRSTAGTTIAPARSPRRASTSATSHDGDYFPCMVAAAYSESGRATREAQSSCGGSGGVASRSFDGWLGFTPLSEGLDQLGLELCTTPDCDLAPPSTDPDG